MEPDTTTATTAFSLPPEILPLMLRHLDCKQRLAVAALVSHTWHAAAVAATASITTSLDPRDTTRHSSISSWLGKHGGQLTSLSIVGLHRMKAPAATVASNDDLEDDGSVDSEYYYNEYHAETDTEPSPTIELQLPLQQLRQLRSLNLKSIRLLHNSSTDDRTGSTAAHAHADIPAGPLPPLPTGGNQQQHSAQQQLEGPITIAGNASSNSSPPQSSPLCGLSALTSLQLDNVVLVGFEGGLRCLSGLTGLQRLELEHDTTAATADRAAAVWGGADDGSGDECEDAGEGWEEASDWSGSDEDLDTYECEERITDLAALSQLRQLTHLSFRQMYSLHDADLAAPLSSLQQLKEFKFYLYQPCPDCLITYASFAVLPPSLTMLEVLGAYDVNLGCTTTPSLVHNTQLQHLEVYGGGGCRYLEPALLRSLVALTHLTLEREYSWQGVVGPFSCLQQLRELKIVKDVSGSDLAGLPATLTRLEFELGGFDSSLKRNTLSSSSAPGLYQLTGLQHLVVHANSSTVNPSVLCHMQQLRHLKLSGENVLYAALRNDSLPALLELLPQMQQLQHLDLSCNTVAPLPPSDLHHYSALVSSSNLTYLDLECAFNMVPLEAKQLLREQAQQLPRLKHLKL